MAVSQTAILPFRLARSQSIIDIASVASLTVAVKFAGAFKTAISARVFGLSDALDAYLIAFSIFSFLCDSLAGALTPTLVPMFVKRSASGGRDVYTNYGGTLYRTVLLFFAVAAVILMFRTVILDVLAAGFSAKKIALTRSLMLVLAPMFPLAGITAVWRSLLNSGGRFAAPAISPVMTPLTATAFLVFAHRSAGIYALAFGSTVGAIAEVSILAVYLSNRGIPILPVWRGSLIDAQWFRRDYTPMVFSSFVHAGVNIVDQGIAALLASGSVSVLNLGTRLVAVVMAIGPTTVSTVFLPRLSRLAVSGKWVVLRRTVSRSLLVSMSGMCVLSFLLVTFSKPLAHLVFEKGSSTPIDLPLLSLVQALSFLRLPFAIGSVILVRVIVSLRRNGRLLFISLFALAANAILDLWLIRPFGVGGITLSTAIVQALTFVALFQYVYSLLNRAALKTAVLA